MIVVLRVDKVVCVTAYRLKLYLLIHNGNEIVLLSLQYNTM